MKGVESVLEWPTYDLIEECLGRTWNYETFIGRAKEFLSGLWESSGFEYRVMHSYRVFQIINGMKYYPELQGVEDIPWPLIKIAALFHDVGLTTLAQEVGRLNIFDPDVLRGWEERHAGYAVPIIRTSLSGLLNEDEVSEVCRIASGHASLVAENDLPTKILQDADTIDECGIVQLWRMSAISTNHNLDMPSQFKWYFSVSDSEYTKRLERLHFESSKTIVNKRKTSIDRTMLMFWQQVNGLDIRFASDSFPWLQWEERVRRSEIVIEIPRGTRHPEYPHIIYPFDYGYIKGYMGWGSMEQDIMVGDLMGPLTGVVVTADFIKQDSELKLLWGLNKEELDVVNSFYDADPKNLVCYLIHRKG